MAGLCTVPGDAVLGAPGRRNRVVQSARRNERIKNMLVNKRDAPTTQRESKIMTELEILGKMLEEITKELQILDTRLIPICSPAPDSHTPPEADEVALIILAGQLKGLRRRAEGIFTRVEDLNSRLDL